LHVVDGNHLGRDGVRVVVMHHPTLLRRASLAVIVVLLAACSRAGAPTSSAAPASEAPGPSGRPAQSLPAVATVGPSAPTVIGEVPEAILDAILADAAQRSGVEADDIAVTRAESVTWSDGSLDCPEPGMSYTQALVDGYHVVLDAGGEELDYRVTAAGSFVLCEGGRPAG
jgi:hypothetical protein